jgi:sulfofructose kinase
MNHYEAGNGVKSMDIDVLCVGHAAYDLVFPVDHHPEADEKCFAAGLVSGGGGPAANAAVTVARLGGIAAFAGYLGRDVFGTMHFEELVSEGVVTSMVVRGPRPTPVSSIIVKPDGKRTIVTYKGSTPILGPGEVDFALVRPKVILFDGHQPVISVPLAMEARARGIPAVLDAGSVHKGTVELGPLCTCLVASEKFAAGLSGEKDPRMALNVLARMAPVAVITLGETGLVWASACGNPDAPGGVLHRLPPEAAGLSAAGAPRHGSLGAFAVDAVDTTGAGDIFHGAFALRIARGDGLLSALRYASAAAALGCTKMGARAGAPTRAEVQSLYDTGIVRR